MSERLKEFFLVSLPGLEDLLEAEIKAWFPEFGLKREYGGVTAMAPLAEGLAMNLALKIPTRILVRAARFRARDFPKLYGKVTDFDWEEWLDPACTLEVFAAAKKSRLKIKSRIEETCLDAWKDHQRDRGVKPDAKKRAKLYVRVVEDEVTLSLDTSGERLHKRGRRQHVGEAPLRETIAAALLQMAARHAAGPEPVELVDPMAGSGTFLLEAAERDQLVDSREFGFEIFAARPTAAPKRREPGVKFATLTGFERDTATLQAARHNLGAHPATLVAEDFFAAAPLPPVAPGHQRWAVVNPPYGERLPVDRPLARYYADLFAALERVASPDLACVLLPSKAVKGKFLLPGKWKVREKRPFLNGGIPVTAFVFARLRTP